ncbi:MAG: type IV pilin [Haloarculaceae archaeon]
MRAVSSVVGTVVLLGVVVVGATAVFAAVPADEPATVPTARLSLTAEAGPDRVALTHEGGNTLSAASLDVTVRVDGDPVTHQPPVPFFAATGFESGPTGPFNSAHRGQWRAGETAALRLASTNTQLDPGDSVSVTVRTDAGVVARLETTA